MHSTARLLLTPNGICKHWFIIVRLCVKGEIAKGGIS